jgi:hypothetical protein
VKCSSNCANHASTVLRLASSVLWTLSHAVKNEPASHGQTVLAIRRKVVAMSPDYYGFLHLGEQNHASERRSRRRNEKAVIAARIQSDNCRGGIAADPVCFNPLSMPCCREIPALRLVGNKHECVARSLLMTNPSHLVQAHDSLHRDCRSTSRRRRGGAAQHYFSSYLVG